MAMVAVGGSIGTGLLLGSAAALQIAGPGVILSFLLAALINWTVTLAMGELASRHPAAGAFGLYGDLYLNPWAGFISRAGYWAAICISIGAEMVAAATYLAFWFPAVPGLVWVVLFSLLLLLVNLWSVGHYGRFEYWFAMIKLATLGAFVVIGGALLLARRVPAQYTAQGGFLPNGALAPLLAMGFAVYTFGGVEMVAITSGESRSPGEIPRAVRLTFVILTSVYVGAIIVLAGIMPWNRAGVTESPFVSVFRHVGIPSASHVMNFVVLTAALSGSNAALYVGSRMLFSLARTGWAPAALGKLNSVGSPRRALIVSSFGILLALALEKWSPQDAFVSIISAALVGMLLSWLVTLAAHVKFRRQLPPGELPCLPGRSPLGAPGSILGFGLVLVAILQSGRLALVSGFVYMIVLTAAYFLLKPRPRRT